MNPYEVHKALRDVREIQAAFAERRRMKGLSGRARCLGGCVALAAALAALRWLPGAVPFDLFCLWGGVFLAALGINTGALLLWYRSLPERTPAKLRPVLESLPVWLTGGVVTIALWRSGQEDLLYGLWMCLYALGHGISRSLFPRSMSLVGLYYLACGFFCLAWPAGLFAKPLVMGAVFFAGELAAGLVMHWDNSEGSLADFFRLGSNKE
jgi:hypothetical protein